MISHAPSQVKPALGFPQSAAFEFNPNAKEITRRPDVSDAGKVLFGVLLNDARFRSGGSSSRASNERLASETGWAARKVQRVFSELERLGLIRRTFKASSQVQRTSVVIAWIPASSAGMSNPTCQHVASVAPGMSPVSPRHVRNDAVGMSNPSCIKERSQESERTGISLSTLGKTGGEEKTGGAEPRPTASEIAAAMRAMVAGKYAPQVFDGQPTAAPSVAPAVAPAAPAPVESAPAPEPAPPPRATGQPQAVDVRSMAGRVGYSAVAAAGFRKRKTPDQQLAALAEYHRRRGAPPSPAPSRPTRIDEARAESLRIPHTFGEMVKPGGM